jgi:peptidoglycan/LPS O-acetylase OafA/YrhL
MSQGANPVAASDRSAALDTPNHAFNRAGAGRQGVVSMKHIPQLDGLRGLAILMVFLHHAYQIKLLWMGVDLFFVLSGYLITCVLLRPRTGGFREYMQGFYARRMRRLVAPYLFLLAAVSVVYGISWLRHGYLYLGLTNFLRPLGIAYPKPMVVLWSLAVEEQFYFFWPLAVFFLTRRRLAWLAAGLMILAPVLRGVAHFPSHWPVFMLTPFRMDGLAAGALICLMQHRLARAPKLSLTLAGVAGLGALGWMHISEYGNVPLGNVLIYECTLAIGVGLLLWALSSHSALLTWSPLRYMGKISYTFYLFHALALVLIPSPIAAFVATIVFAALSWNFLESPLLANRRAHFTNVSPALQPVGA